MKGTEWKSRAKTTSLFMTSLFSQFFPLKNFPATNDFRFVRELE